MFVKLLQSMAVGALAIASSPASAQPDRDGYMVRNDTTTTLHCRTSRHGSSRFDRVVLRPGGEWRHAASGGAAWRIVCDPPVLRTRYRLEPGHAYHFVPRPRSGDLMLVPR